MFYGSTGTSKGPPVILKLKLLRLKKGLNKKNKIIGILHKREGGGQGVARPRFKFRDRDFYNSISRLRLKISILRPRSRQQISKLSRQRLIETLIFQSCRNRDWAKVVESKTFFRQFF